MRKLEIDERDFADPDELMDHVARKLDFPAYFGGNLAALHDCLGDLDEPTQVRLRRRSPKGRTWFEAITLTFMRTACENENLSVRVDAK